MSHSSPAPTPLNHASPALNRKSSLVRIGGALGIAACSIGLAIFLIGCFGFSAVFSFSVIPALLCLPGFILTVIGGVRGESVEDTHVLSSLAVNLFAIVGSALLISVWQGWSLFHSSGGQV